MKLTEAFSDFSRRVIGTRTIPLSYVIRETIAVPAAAPPLMTNQPYAEAFGSVKEELIDRATHTHPLYCDDNTSLYFYLEEATRSTMYTSSIQPFSRRKDGRGAWFAITNQYAGKDKWGAELKKQDDLLHTYKWKGQSNFLLDKFISQHRNAFVSMQQCAVHVEFQLPNEYSRVGYLLDAIETTDASLQAAMALIRNDDNPVVGKRSNFEATSTCKRTNNPARHRGAEISSIDSSQMKSGVGTSGVSLRYHKRDEYLKLTAEQKKELHKWRDSSSTSKTNGKKSRDDKSAKRPKPDRANNNSDKRLKRLISSVIAAERAKDNPTPTPEPDQNAKDGAYLLSLVQVHSLASAHVGLTNAISLPPPVKATPKPPAVTLKSILKRAANSGPK